MSSYLFHTNHPVSLPAAARLSPSQVADWLERTLRSEDLRVERTSETTVAFRPYFTLDNWTDASRIGALVARGEIEVSSGPEGPVMRVSANPRAWIGLIPVAQLTVLFGWASVSEFLRWGAGLGGLAVGGIVLVLTWGSLNSFFSNVASTLQMLRTRPDAPRTGAA